MNYLVKITKLDGGEMVPKEEQKWCATHTQDTVRVICGGEALDGSSSFEYEQKTVKRGGINCPECLSAIREIKMIKL